MRSLRLFAAAAVLLPATVAAAGWGGQGVREAHVYLIDGYRSELGMRGRLIARERDLVDPGLGRVVAEVLRGPTARERDERGLLTGFADDVRVSSVAAAGGTARIRLVSDTPPRHWPDGVYATAQLVYTLTELDGIERVVLTVNGRRCCVYDRRQRPWTKPLTRRNFASWQGAPAE